MEKKVPQPKKNRLEYGKNPLWECLRKNYTMEGAFHFFGPYTGASIFPKIIDRWNITVRMPLVPSNTNYVGTQFGGSIYSMTDPFYMFILMDNLGEDYMVWDKSAKIEFLRPGTTELTVHFHISPEEIENIRREVSEKKKITRKYHCEILDAEKNAVAKVCKELYIRKIK